MNSTCARVRWRFGIWLVLVVAASAIGGCSRSIGDQCATSVDCSATGDRTCDMSQPGGYCTVEGCDQTSCPDNSACVRFFPEQFLSTPCDPACEDTDPPVASAKPTAASAQQKKCPAILPVCATKSTNDCSADQLCLPSGLCVPRADEQRLCVKTCSSDSDCRGGYQCRVGGALGSLPLLNDPCGTVSFCAPRVD